VLAAVQAVGADVFAAAQSFTNIKPLKGRGQRYILPIKGGQFELIDDSYNASPVSIAAALKVLAGSVVGPSGRRICALGDMRELGDSSADFHRALAPHVRTANVDLVYAAGPGMKHMCGELPDTIGIVHTDKSVELVELLQDEIQPGDVVLVKGSAGSQMNKLVEAFLDFQQGSKEAKHAI
jgi:UDP-N-acetylmuramoyl-tripeptide--D-alanyl-D-alanine ligase